MNNESSTYKRQFINHAVIFMAKTVVKSCYPVSYLRLALTVWEVNAWLTCATGHCNSLSSYTVYLNGIETLFLALISCFVVTPEP